MQIANLLTPELCLLGESITSRKKALQVAATALAENNAEYEAFDVLKNWIEREQLGSTAIGNGVALPHGRLEQCSKPIAVFLVLDNSVDFSAPDQEPVNLLFCLLVPPKYDFSELGSLDTLIETFNNKTLRAQMRNAHNSETLHKIITMALNEQHRVELEEKKQEEKKQEELLEQEQNDNQEEQPEATNETDHS